MRCWLDPSQHILAAAIQLALTRPTRIINHRPFDADRHATCWTPATARTARAKQSRYKPQQLETPET